MFYELRAAVNVHTDLYLAGTDQLEFCKLLHGWPAKTTFFQTFDRKFRKPLEGSYYNIPELPGETAEIREI